MADRSTLRFTSSRLYVLRFIPSRPRGLEQRRVLLRRLFGGLLPHLRVALVGGVDEQVRLFDQLVCRLLRVPGVRALVADEQVAGELVAVVGVPEEPGLDEAGAELADDHVGGV